MNEIKIKGGNARQKRLAYNAIQLVINKFMPRHRTLDITLYIKDFSKTDIFGECSYEDCNIKPRTFEIFADKSISDKMFIQTILHEMVHVKQYVLGELCERYQNKYKLLWKNRDYTEADYDDQPWEKEAHRLELPLYKKYIEIYGE
jgi:hypothetical protein